VRRRPGQGARRHRALGDEHRRDVLIGGVAILAGRPVEIVGMIRHRVPSSLSERCPVDPGMTGMKRRHVLEEDELYFENLATSGTLRRPGGMLRLSW
jgi:hypothetical protein